MDRERGRRPPRLLLVATTVRTLEAFLIPLCEEARIAGWQVAVLASGVAESAVVSDAVDHSFEIGWRRSPLSISNVGAALLVRRLLATHDFDVVHVHTPVAAFITRLSARTLRRSRRPRVIYTAHGFHFFQGSQGFRQKVWFGLEFIAARWADVLVAINREDRRAAVLRLHIPEGDVRLFPGVGIDLERYGPGGNGPDISSRVRLALGIGSESRMVLCIAELNQGKRIGRLLRALAFLGRSDIHLVCAGTGPELERLRTLASDLGMSSQTHFVGFRNDIPALLTASDVLVITSDREGLPRAVMEAMANGTPVVAANIRGCTDLLDGGAGLLVDASDPEVLGRAIEQVVDHPETSLEMSSLALERIRDFDIVAVLALHMNLYREQLGKIP